MPWDVLGWFSSKCNKNPTSKNQSKDDGYQVREMRPLKVFLLITGQTYQAHQQILDLLNAQESRVMPTDDLKHCDVILLFCPILSRVRSDVEAAFRQIPDGGQEKGVVLILMHHTRKPDKVLNQIQWKDEFPFISHEVQVLYHESQNGLLQCPRNQEALQSLQRMCAEFQNMMKTHYGTSKHLLDSTTQGPPAPAQVHSLVQEMMPLKVFLVITGQIYQAPQQILDLLNAQESRVMPTDDPQYCDVILLFCPILSWVRSDVEAAFRQIPDGGQEKQVVLIAMHHTRKPDKVLNQIQWKEEFPFISHGVQVLYHESKNGLLWCPRNEEALQNLQSMCAQFQNMKKTHYGTSKPVLDSMTQQPPAPAQVNPSVQEMIPLKVFLVITGQIYQAHQQILDLLIAQGSRVMPTDDPQHCDVILLFCPILSRVRSDVEAVEAAFRQIPDGGQEKPVVLILMHRTHKPDKVLNQIQWKDEFPFIIQEVQVLYHESENGLFQCPRNEEALLNLQSMCAQFQNMMKTHYGTSKPVLDSLTQQPSAPSEVKPAVQEMMPLKVFLVITGQIYQAHQQILDLLNAQESRVMPTDDPQHCDVILLFYPILSQDQSDVEAAFRQIPDGGQEKPVVLILMHHTHKPDKVLNQIQWKDEFPFIIQEVQVLYHESKNGLFQCPRNQEALQNLQSMCAQFQNMMKTHYGTSKPVLDSLTQQPSAPAEVKPPVQEMMPLKVFLVITGQIYQNHQQILDLLNAQESRVMPTDDPQHCDVILLFCPILSQVQSDVEAAFRQIPDGAQEKPVVLVLLHHTCELDHELNQIQWKAFPSIIHEVQFLHHERQNGLLQCPRNEEALQSLQRKCAEYQNMIKTDVEPK